MNRRIAVVVALSLAGCANMARDVARAFPDRRAEINAAYERGEITFVEREQLLQALDRQNQESFYRSQVAAKQFQNASQYQPPANAQPVRPLNAPDYLIYDQTGRQVGTLRSR